MRRPTRRSSATTRCLAGDSCRHAQPTWSILRTDVVCAHASCLTASNTCGAESYQHVQHACERIDQLERSSEGTGGKAAEAEGGGCGSVHRGGPRRHLGARRPRGARAPEGAVLFNKGKRRTPICCGLPEVNVARIFACPTEDYNACARAPRHQPLPQASQTTSLWLFLARASCPACQPWHRIHHNSASPVHPTLHTPSYHTCCCLWTGAVRGVPGALGGRVHPGGLCQRGPGAEDARPLCAALLRLPALPDGPAEEVRLWAKHAPKSIACGPCPTAWCGQRLSWTHMTGVSCFEGRPIVCASPHSCHAFGCLRDAPQELHVIKGAPPEDVQLSWRSQI